MANGTGSPHGSSQEMEQERYHGRIDRGIRLGIPGGVVCKEKNMCFSRLFFNMREFLFVSEFANLKDGNGKFEET